MVSIDALSWHFLLTRVARAAPTPPNGAATVLSAMEQPNLNEVRCEDETTNRNAVHLACTATRLAVA